MSLNFTYLPRTIETVINRASQRYKGVMVTGMRQVGKSTMLRRMQGDRRYVNLDRYQALDLARQAPDAFFKQYPMPLLIDEFQRAPDLGLEIKAILDETDERGLVWLTGSQKLGLRKAVAEALSGRVASFELFPFSLYELQGKGPEQKPFMPTGELTRGSLDPLTAEELWKIIWQGSWPEVVHDEPDQRDAFFRQSFENLHRKRHPFDRSTPGGEFRALLKRTGKPHWSGICHRRNPKSRRRCGGNCPRLA